MHKVMRALKVVVVGLSIAFSASAQMEPVLLKSNAVNTITAPSNTVAAAGLLTSTNVPSGLIRIDLSLINTSATAVSIYSATNRTGTLCGVVPAGTANAPGTLNLLNSGGRPELANPPFYCGANSNLITAPIQVLERFGGTWGTTPTSN